ncbi:hypothetical protein [Streptomyces zagrosensis]|uniref:SseB protein N-terminal domain-containing protein n=1 Tax=Streptomyces zagrosensis TaxID=1042984 RepID=A0A7W9QFI0_9ACTN|nr:hypothetical protein [Streptomyces zagrosensis]MBB5938062.1 hypothetical protein [Streptomyces zagrosensis]
MGLADECAAMRAGDGDPAALLGEFRRAVVLVPVLRGGWMSSAYGGIRWIYAFTDESALARFLLSQEAPPNEDQEYGAVLGARLLDAVIPGLGDGQPCGVALDVADPDHSTFFPPVRGIVPDHVAVDRTADDTQRQQGTYHPQDVSPTARTPPADL